MWGSTYLAIRVAVEDLPPALLAGVRFILASIVLGALALARGQRLPRTAHAWWVCTVMGVALIVLGNGLVTWAEQWVPSNQAALMAACSKLLEHGTTAAFRRNASDLSVRAGHPRCDLRL